MEKLQLMQIYYGGGQLKPPPCDEPECNNRAIGLWQRKSGKALDLCGQHEPNVTPEKIAAFRLWQDRPMNQPRPEIISDYPPAAVSATA